MSLYKQIIICLLVYITGTGNALAVDKVIIRHSCGKITTDIDITVVDWKTKSPIPGVQLTFFTDAEIDTLKAIRLSSPRDKESPPKTPKGSIAITGSNGCAQLRCVFDYYNPMFADGSERDERSPSGELRIMHDGYYPYMESMDKIFPKSPYLTTLPPVIITLQKIDDIEPVPADVCVDNIEMIIPEKENAANAILANSFFAQPEARQFSNITTDNWKSKWDAHANALIAKSKERGLEAKALEACIKMLNHGRNKQTMLIPPPPSSFGFATTPEEEKIEKEKEKEAIASYEKALAERDNNPEQWYNNDLAIIPVGAYLAKYSKGDCWIIVCKWAYIPGNYKKPRKLGHIMAWAMDAKTASVVAYVTCD